MRLLPFLSSMLYIPLGQVRDIHSLKAELTVTVQPWVGREMEHLYAPTIVQNDETFTIRVYDLSKSGYIGVPRAFGLARFRGLRYVNRTVVGNPKLEKFSNDIKAKDSDQAHFMAACANICTEEGPIDAIVNARTGTGKTVCDLWLTASLGVPTLVIVPTNRLKNQWIDRVGEFYGKKFVKKYVGVAQQDRCDYEGKLIVVGMLPSLARRNYPKSFYRKFGKITLDEVHFSAAPLMSEALMKFPAKVRIGYTATNRDDALRKILTLHFGQPRVSSKQQVLKPLVYEMDYQNIIRLNNFNDRTLLTSLTQMHGRNAAIARFLMSTAYARDRVCVVLSDRTDQLVEIRRRLLHMGMPEKELGMYVGKYRTGRQKAIVRFGTRIMGRLIEGTKPALNLSVVRFNGHLRRLARRGGVKDFEKKLSVTYSDEEFKPSEADYRHMAKTCTLFLATYGIFGVGLDIPRVDMGVEASPRANVVQPIGRLLRDYPGKPQPEWYSLRDSIMPTSSSAPYSLFTEQSMARRRSYAEQKAVVSQWGHI